MAVRTHQVSVVQVQIGRPPRQTLPPRREVLHESVPRLCPVDVRQHQKSPVLNTNLVGGPGFEPGASRSRTVVIACPLVSRRLPRCPPELKLPHLRVRPCPPRATWFRESVPRPCPAYVLISPIHCLLGRAQPLTLTIRARQRGIPSVRCRCADGRPLEQRPARRVPSGDRCSRPARWSFPISRALDRCVRLRAMPSETRPSPRETDGSTSDATRVPASQACRGRAEVQDFRASNREGSRDDRRSRLA